MNRPIRSRQVRGKTAFRPRFESLEDRLALACSVTTGDFDGNGTDDLRIVGDLKNQHVLITEHNTGGNQTRVQVDCNGDADFTDGGDTRAPA